MSENKDERRIGDGGEVRCGDIMHDGTCHEIAGVCGPCGIERRLCGGCSRSRDGGGYRRPEGCGDLLERIAELPDIEPPPGWEERAVERARREGVL